MKFRIFNNSVGVLGLVSLVFGSWSSFADPPREGAGSSGGGHGVVANGRPVFLDLIPTQELETAGLQEIPNLFFNELLGPAAAGLLVRINEVLGQRYPAFTAAWIRTISESKWYLTSQPIPSTEDTEVDRRAGVEPINFAAQRLRTLPHPLGSQVEVVDIVLQEGYARSMDIIGRIAELAHESLQAKLGKRMSRDVLRRVVQAIADNGTPNARRARVEAALNSINPHILQGQFEVSIVPENLPANSFRPSRLNPDEPAELRMSADHYLTLGTTECLQIRPRPPRTCLVIRHLEVNGWMGPTYFEQDAIDYNRAISPLVATLSGRGLYLVHSLAYVIPEGPRFPSQLYSVVVNSIVQRQFTVEDQGIVRSMITRGNLR